MKDAESVSPVSGERQEGQKAPFLFDYPVSLHPLTGFNEKHNNINNLKTNKEQLEMHSRLSNDLRVIGEVHSDKDIRVDGCIRGNVRCQNKVVIGPDGHVEGNIESSVVDVMGKITGNIDVKELIILRSTSFIEGDIHAACLQVEQGARLLGRCKMKAKTPAV